MNTSYSSGQREGGSVPHTKNERLSRYISKCNFMENSYVKEKGIIECVCPKLDESSLKVVLSK
jgi:hypothetical protein